MEINEHVYTKKQKLNTSDCMIEASLGMKLNPKILSDCRILIIGAGALGCEILKNLVITGFLNIDIIDMDKIELHNLHRQFLFRDYHIGQSKAIIAAQMIQRMFPMHAQNGLCIQPHDARIQDKDTDFYIQFHLILCGLDSVEARRWINALLVGIVDPCNPTDTTIPMIDGGTEGLHGQCRLVIPKITACIECNLDFFDMGNEESNTHKRYPLCTIAQTPRLPEHCIEWAMLIAFPQEYKDQFDPHDIEHLNWVYSKAKERAEQCSIEQVSWPLTLGVVQNIVPSMISTNALIAGMCVMTAIQLLQAGSLVRTQSDSDYYMFHGALSGIYCYPFQAEKRMDCPVCSGIPYTEKNLSSMILSEWISQFSKKHGWNWTSPCIRTGERTLYMSTPLCLFEATKHQLNMKLGELFDDNSKEIVLVITDPTLPPNGIQVNIHLES